MNKDDPVREATKELLVDPDADAEKAVPHAPPQTIDAEPTSERGTRRE